MSTPTKRVTRREMKAAERVLRRQVRDLEDQLRMEQAAAEADIDESGSEFASDSEPEPEELRQFRPRDRRPATGRKLNRPQRESTDPLSGYEHVAPISLSFAVSEPGARSRARACARATGQDGSWWPRLFA
jgi:hypothetical protein